MMQICAQALGVPLSTITLVTGDTDLTPDAGKTSASRETFVSGAALRRSAEHLRRQALRLVNADESACFSIEAGSIKVRDGTLEHSVDLSRMPAVTGQGDVLLGEGTFDPPTTALDANGHGVPYATFHVRSMRTRLRLMGSSARAPEGERSEKRVAISCLQRGPREQGLQPSAS
jgi:aldehyde oxidoreductase